jgi:hypothetical protein
MLFVAFHQLVIDLPLRAAFTPVTAAFTRWWKNFP